MARPTIELVAALRTTAARLRHGADYKWSSFSACNCGNLAQTVTALSAREIYEAAFQRPGDWAEQAREFCPGTGYPLEYIFERLFALGLTRDDIGHLERLSDPRVRRAIGIEVELRHTLRADVVRYMDAWANLLEDELPALPAQPLHLLEAAE